MELNKLCIIVPADFDDDARKHQDEPKKSSPRQRGCGGARIVDLVKSALSELYESGLVNNVLCGQGQRTTEKQRRRGCRCWGRRRRRGGEALSSFHDTDGTWLEEKEVSSDNPRMFSYSELYIGTNGFSEKEVLGSGGFGRVYKAVLPSDGTAVAVKCVAEDGERFEKAFAAELVAVAHLRHRNLVRLRGWCVEEGRLLLVYDYMPNRSLDRALFRGGAGAGAGAAMGWPRRRRVVEGLAAALHYLHDQLDTQIVHRDVKASNVMLDSRFDARLGDFGLARWQEHDGPAEGGPDGGGGGDMFRLSETTRIGGTIGYLPPESFRRGRSGAATAKSDVFSFGIVVLEVVSGRRAVDLACPEEEIVLLDWVRGLSDEGPAAALRAADPRIRDGALELEAAADVERLIHVALLCTLHAPESRPGMKWVAEALSGSLPGGLPPLPSFRAHPKYINLASPTNTSSSSNNEGYSSSTSTTTTKTAASSIFATAGEDTIYATADDVGGESPRRTGSVRRHGGGGAFPMVQAPREISYEEIAAATDGFSDARRVAELDFGTAYRGALGGGAGPEVLVKRLGMKTCPALRVRFSAELQNLGRLRHRNLVQLRGWCTERGEMLVVYDYSPSRLLSRAVFGGSLRWRRRYDLVKSLASAVRYLHEEWDEQVIHRSITSSAVILDPDANPRLGSFALAEFLTRNEHGHHIAASESSKSVRGIFGYMAPEYVESGEATTAADVYSFGVVVLEVVTGQPAVDFRRPEALLVKRVREFLARRRPAEELADIRLDGSDCDPRELARLVKLGVECTGSDPASRPSMREIVRILDGNDKWFAERAGKRESLEQWKEVNASSLSLVKRIQALGIQ